MTDPLKDLANFTPLPIKQEPVPVNICKKCKNRTCDFYIMMDDILTRYPHVTIKLVKCTAFSETIIDE